MNRHTGKGRMVKQMTDIGRRDFFRKCLVAGAALAVSGTAAAPAGAEASAGQIKGVCLYVPSLGKASEFVETMNRNAPGEWTAHPLQGTLDDLYFQTRETYREARSNANTFVGVVDPASFAVIRAAITDSGGSLYYSTYEERGRVTFSARL
jgi:hypothetical protein